MSWAWRRTSVALASAELPAYWLCRGRCPGRRGAERPAGFGLTAGTVSDDELALLVQERQFVQNVVGAVEADRFYLRNGLANPFRRRLLGVAIGQSHGMSLLVEPGGQVDGEGRFADTAFGIRDCDNHVDLIARLSACLQAVFPCGRQAVRQDGWQEWWQAGLLALRPHSSWLSCGPAIERA